MTNTGDTPITDAAFNSAVRRLDPYRFREITDEVAGYHLVLQACNRLGIAATEAELQEGADSLRRANGLASASDTHAWLRESGLSVDDLEQHVQFWILARKLLTKVHGAGAVKDRFQADIYNYAKAALSVITVDTEELASDILEQVRARQATFPELARKHSVDARTAKAGGMVGWTALGRVPREFRAPVMASAGGGKLIGPIESAGKWHVVEVAATVEAQLTPARERDVIHLLLGEWIDQQGGGPSIERSSAH